MVRTYMFINPKCLPKKPNWLLRCLLHGLFVGIMIIIMLLFCQGIAKAETLQSLTASWYSVASLKKEGTWKKGERKMANGKRFNENDLTCACRLYPLGSMIKVTNLNNNKSIIVKVTDRIGKRFATTRIDLSKKAFSLLESDLDKGLIKVSVEKIEG